MQASLRACVSPRKHCLLSGRLTPVVGAVRSLRCGKPFLSPMWSLLRASEKVFLNCQHLSRSPLPYTCSLRMTSAVVSCLHKSKSKYLTSWCHRMCPPPQPTLHASSTMEFKQFFVPATGGKPDNELSWVWLFDGENQQMQSVTGESLFELELLENDLTLWATNFNQCGVTVSDTLEFAVLPEMLAPSIVTDTSLFPLCYGSPTAAIEMDQLPAGATNVWSYDWILQG